MMKIKFGLLSLLGVFSFVLTASCSSPQAEDRSVDTAKPAQGKVYVSSGIIENRTPIVLTDVKVVHHPTLATANFSQIQPGQRVKLEFRATELMAHRANLSWFEDKQRFAVKLNMPVIKENSTAHLNTPALQEDSLDHPLTLVYRILPGTRASVSYLGYYGE